MNIEIPDNVLHRVMQKELTKMSTSSYSIETAVQKAMQEIATQKIKEMIKSDSKYAETLSKLIEVNMLAAFELVAKRISKDLGESLVSSIEAEFKTDSN